MASDPHRLSHQGQQPSPHHPYPQQQPPQQQQQQQQQDSTNASAAAAAAAAAVAAQADQPKKAKRKRITPEQLEDLVGLFEKTDTPSFEIRENLAKKLGMTNREIQVTLFTPSSCCVYMWVYAYVCLHLSFVKGLSFRAAPTL